MSQHGATASRSLADDGVVEAVLEDFRTAPIAEPLRAALGVVEKLVTAPGELTAGDVEEARAAGASDEALEDAVHMAAVFVIFNKLADSLDWEMLSAETYDKRAAIPLERGYVVPDELLE